MAKVSEFFTKSFASSVHTVPEITPKVLILGVVLTIFFAMLTAVIGLKTAQPIAASLLAIFTVKVIFSRFRQSTLLEQNAVQTMVSASEAVVTGTIVTLPVLLMMGYWQTFDYLQTVMIILLGGLCGILFSVPLRKDLMMQGELLYPQGVAIAELLKTNEKPVKSTKRFLWAAASSAVVTLLQTGFKIISDQIHYWIKIGNTAIGGSLMFSPLLMAVGYRMGISTLTPCIVGAVVTWGIVIPILGIISGLPDAEGMGTSLAIIHKLQLRYVGVGVFAMGSFWGSLRLITRLFIKNIDKNISVTYVVSSVVVAALFIFSLCSSFINDTPLEWAQSKPVLFYLFMTLCILWVGFWAAFLASNLVGLIGTLLLPVFGVATTILTGSASLLLVFSGEQMDLSKYTAITIQPNLMLMIFVSIVTVAAMVSAHTMQILKTGQRVGATLWKQQCLLMIGVVVAALILPILLQILFQAYGMGNAWPRLGMNSEQTLPALQATSMATLLRSFIAGNFSLGLIKLGVGLGLVAIVLDEYLKYKRSSVRFPVILFALGIYLPLSYVSGLLVGAVIRFFVQKKRKLVQVKATSMDIVYTSGIIVGEAIVGTILIMLFAYCQSTEVLSLNKIDFLLPFVGPLKPFENALGLIFYVGLGVFLYKQAVQKH